MKKILLGLIVLLTLYSAVTTYKLNNISPEYVVQHDSIPGDTVFTEVIKTNNIPVKVVVVDIDTVKIPTDSTELVNKYKEMYTNLYASKTYIDTLKNDSSATVILNTYLSKNSLDSLKMQFKNNKVTSINNTFTYNEPKLKAGSFIGYMNISPIVSYKVTHNISLLASYNILQKSPAVGILYNIK